MSVSATHEDGRMTREEEHALAVRARSGDKAAFDELVTRSQPLVRSIARHWQGHGIPFEDLVQQGTLGLIRAVEKFEPERGLRLSTYATPWIRQACSRVVGKGDLIRVPIRLGERRRKLRAVTDRMRQELGREPKADELAAELGLTRQEVTDALDVAQVVEPVDDERDYAAAVSVLPGMRVEDVETRVAVMQLLAAADAPDVDYAIVEAILDGDGQTTQVELQKLLGLTDGQLRGRIARLCVDLEELRAA